MSFQPVLPTAGLSGWRFLQRTLPMQSQAFAKAPALQRDTAYFEQKIGTIKTADDLVSDRRLLRVTLGAFGLQSDIDSRAFIRKVLADGVEDPKALSNRLTDERYKKLAQAFGFGAATPPRTGQPGFGQQIAEMYRRQQFEVAVGDQDETLRLALNADRDLPDLAAGSGSENARWFRIMGTPPLRTVFETAFGLPKGFGRLDVDQQREVFRDKARQQIGMESLDQLADPAMRDKLIQRYLLRASVAESMATGPGAIALTLLQGAGFNRFR